MKTKTLFIAILFFSSFNLFAGNVTQQQAKKVALNFYYEKYNQFKGQVLYDQLSIRSIHVESDGIQNFYYVFQINKAGFVMVSADDRIAPVLGYSFKNEFVSENQPPNVRWWFQQYNEQVRFVREKQLESEKRINDKWEYYLNENFDSIKIATNSKEVEQLLTTEWNQGWPYNYYCPEDPAGPGGHAWAGCVATAYAQMLYYWRFPLHGSGYHCYTPATFPEYGEQCADFENTWYQWDEMCDVPLTVNTAIAELMYHVGVAYNMDYGPDGSGCSGYPELIEPYFNISTDYDSLRRDYYTNEEWVNIMVDQLNQNLPLGYIGFTSNLSTGHMWVCDGYQDSTHFHMNWGWGGQSNGYYYLNSLQGFDTLQYLGINFYPDTINYSYPNYETGNDTIVSFEGSISDGSGPIHNYLNNTQASWLINPQNEYDSVTNIVIMVKRFDLFTDGDKLSIYDGPDNTVPLLAELSGNIIPNDIVSTGNKVFIEFYTDAANTASGFYLNYKTDQPVWCNSMTPVSDPTATISDGSGSFYYYNSTTCQWMIDPGENEPLTLYFNYFDTEGVNDWLKIYDVVSQEVVAEISGAWEIPPDPVTVESGQVMLVFKSNNSIRGDGWEVWYDINTSLPKSTLEIDFLINPNPVTSDMKISFNLQSEQYVSIQLFDILGQELEFLVNKIITPGFHSINGNMEYLTEGIYFCRLQVGETVVSKKIIKL